MQRLAVVSVLTWIPFLMLLTQIIFELVWKHTPRSASGVRLMWIFGVGNLKDVKLFILASGGGGLSRRLCIELQKKISWRFASG